jgi:hypothetical protein
MYRHAFNRLPPNLHISRSFFSAQVFIHALETTFHLRLCIVALEAFIHFLVLSSGYTKNNLEAALGDTKTTFSHGIMPALGNALMGSSDHETAAEVMVTILSQYMSMSLSLSLVM